MKKFKDLAIGEAFNSNGSHWKKKSTRTAYLLEKHTIDSPKYIDCRIWFHFGANETITAINGGNS
jgi:hypothetical protein